MNAIELFGAAARPLLNTARVRRVIARALRGRVDHIKSLAERTWTIWPAEASTVPPAIYLGGSLERIRGLSVWRRWDNEMRMIKGERFEHAATTAHQLRAVDLVGAYLYKGAAKDSPGVGIPQLWLRDRRERIADAELVTTNSGSHFFGCWLLEDIPLAVLVGPSPNKIVMAGHRYPHESGFRELLGEAAPRTVTHAHIDRLTLYTDYGQNRCREERYRLLRARLRVNLGGDRKGAPAGIYLKRGGTGEPRIICNEDEVEALMRRLGFRIVEPARLSAAEISRQTLDAKVVVSCEGSHISNVIYSVADDACFVVLQPPDRFSLAYKEYTDRMAMRFAFVVGEPAEGGFTVAPDDIARIIDLVA